MAQTDDLARQLRDAAAQALRIANGASPEALARRPAPGKWSAAECVEHLNLTTRAYLPRLEAAYRELREKDLRGDGPYGIEFGARLLLWLLEPPARLRMPTTAPFQPEVATRAGQAIPDFAALQDRLLEMLEQGRGLALDRVRIASPFSDRVRYNVYAAYALIAAHQRRHLWQAGRAIG